MSLNTRITRYSLTTTAQSIAIGSGSSKVILQALDSDIGLAYDEGNFAANIYFTISAGSTIILDQPVPSATQLVYVRTLTASTGVLEVWIN
jgi:hypothetical protein